MRLTTAISISAPPEEVSRWREEAWKAHKTLSEWVRDGLAPLMTPIKHEVVTPTVKVITQQVNKPGVEVELGEEEPKKVVEGGESTKAKLERLMSARQGMKKRYG
jgi:hypothetical protein